MEPTPIIPDYAGANVRGIVPALLGPGAWATNLPPWMPAVLADALSLEVRAASIVLIVCGLVAAISAFTRWMRNELAMRLGRPLPSSPMLLIVTSIVALTALVALVVVVLT